jgi:ribosome biogenesis GTPase / thiamine phosphate phosphatase
LVLAAQERGNVTGQVTASLAGGGRRAVPVFAYQRRAALPEFHLGTLGWTPELADNLEPGLVPGRVVAAHRAAFDVQTAAGVVRTRLPGRLMHEGVEVAVGDWVGLGDGLIRSVLPRRSALVRKSAGLTSESQTLAANVDIAFVVSSLGPDLDPRRIERYLVTIWESGAVPEVVLTKADRLDDPWPLVAQVEAVALGVPVHVVSAVTGQGVDTLRARLCEGATAVLIGSSGVGKSTLVNRWVGRELMAVKETRADDDEGRHTTTHRELIVLPGGGIVIDTPGIRELQLWDSGGLDEAFADVEELAAECRFNDCSHNTEPGCAVKAALGSGELSRERHAGWLKLQRELYAIAIRHDARLRREERRKWHLRIRDARERTRRR